MFYTLFPFISASGFPSESTLFCHAHQKRVALINAKGSLAQPFFVSSAMHTGKDPTFSYNIRWWQHPKVTKPNSLRDPVSFDPELNFLPEGISSHSSSGSYCPGSPYLFSSTFSFGTLRNTLIFSLSRLWHLSKSSGCCKLFFEQHQSSWPQKRSMLNRHVLSTLHQLCSLSFWSDWKKWPH